LAARRFELKFLADCAKLPYTATKVCWNFHCSVLALLGGRASPDIKHEVARHAGRRFREPRKGDETTKEKCKGKCNSPSFQQGL